MSSTRQDATAPAARPPRAIPAIPAKLGIYGGTFNPIHLGHLRAAEEVARLLKLQQVIFVPSARPPHKDDDPLDPIAPATERLQWVELAVADNPRFAVDPIEIERRGPSYLVDTLRAYRDRLAPEFPVFILGRDAFCDMGNWREPRALLTLAHFAVTTRPGKSSGEGNRLAPLARLADWLPGSLQADVEIAPDGLVAHHREAKTWIRLLEIAALDVSASAIRRRLRAGRCARGLVPENARTIVEASGCYRAPTGGNETRTVKKDAS